MGLKLMVDFVPNHGACDIKEINSNIDYFIRNAPNMPRPYNQNLFLPDGQAYGKDPFFDPWTDTVQFNIWKFFF
jgi:hypothetical protein